MGWDGMGWDGMGWDGMGWDGMGWDGMGWDGMQEWVCRQVCVCMYFCMYFCGNNYLLALHQDVPVPPNKRKLLEKKFKSPPEVRRFSRFLDTPMYTSTIAPKVHRNTMYNYNVQNHGKNIVDSIPAGTITLNDDIGKLLVKNSSPQSPLGISCFGRLNLKVVQNPNENQIKNLAQNCKTKYVIVHTAPNSGDSKVQKLSTDKNTGGMFSGETKLGSHGDITINGQKYKIDTEFKLNDLVKDNENAFLSAETQKDILARLPSILKASGNSKTGMPTHFKIVNMMEGTQSSLSSPVSSPTSLSSPKVLVQSIAPVLPKTSIFSSLGDGSIMSAKNVHTMSPPIIISNVKGSTFHSTIKDYSVFPAKKLQSIAPAPPKVPFIKSSISSSDCSLISNNNMASRIDNSVYPLVTNASGIGGKKRAAPKHNSVVMDTGKDVDNSTNKLPMILSTIKPDPDDVVDVKPREIVLRNPIKPSMEIRLPENTVHRPSRKIILNSPLNSINPEASRHPPAPYVIHNLTTALSESVNDLKVSIPTSSNPGASPIKSLYGMRKTAIITNQRYGQISLTSGLNSSTPTTTNSNLCVNRSSDMKTLITTNSYAVSPLLVKPINSSTTKMTASSLVKSIKELRASLNTYSNAAHPTLVNIRTTIASSNNKTASLTVKSVTNLSASVTTNSIAASSPLGKPISTLKTLMAASRNATVTPLSGISIKEEPNPSLWNYVSDQNSAINHTTSQSLVKPVSKLNFSMSTHDIAESSSCKSVNDVSSLVTTNSLLPSISQQIQQQIKISGTVPSKTNILQPSTKSSIFSTMSSPVKIPSQNQNGDGKNLANPTSSNQVLDLNNGIKIVGTYLNSEDVKARMAMPEQKNPSIYVSMNNQTNTSIISPSKYKNGEPANSTVS